MTEQNQAPQSYAFCHWGAVHMGCGEEWMMLHDTERVAQSRQGA